MRSIVSVMATATMIFMGIATTTAQEFALQIGPPIAGGVQPTKKSLFVVRPTGCPDPAAAKVSATAEGVVDGNRQTIALAIIPLQTPGVHAIPNEWAKSGMWVIALTGTCSGKTAGAIVLVGPVTPSPVYRRDTIALLSHSPTRQEIDASLKALTTGGAK
jgi:acetaldehyde dehydrogenase (acetylating)